MSAKHHKEIPSTQKKLLNEVKKLVISMEEIGDPFMEESNDRFTLNTKCIMSSDVIQDMKIAESKGLAQSIKFREERIVQKSNRL